MKLILPTKHDYYDKYMIISMEPLILDYMDLLNGYRTQNTWSRCIVRKFSVCRISGELISPGSLAYRPTTNGQNKTHRMLANELEKYLPKQKSII